MIELFESKERWMPIASYLSNTAPPQIGSIIDIGCFVEEMPARYIVTGVEIIPISSDKLNQTSDAAIVEILVKKKR